jgi:hypothetical protein
MKTVICAAIAFAVFASQAQAQSLNDILSTLTGHMGQLNAEQKATLASIDAGDRAGACQHTSAAAAYADAALSDLDDMQATLDADTTISDAARADWQGHITDARGSVNQLSASNHSNVDRYCS